MSPGEPSPLVPSVDVQGGCTIVRFRTTVLTTGKTAAGFVVPDEVMAALAAGKKPAVSVTINRYTYRSTVATVHGRPMIGASPGNPAAAGGGGRRESDDEARLDTAPP